MGFFNFFMKKAAGEKQGKKDVMVSALLNPGSKESVDFKTLLRDLNSSNIDIKRQTINRVGEDNVKEAVDNLIEILTNTQEDEGIRSCSALAIGKIGDLKAVEVLKWTPESRQKSTEFKLYIQLQAQLVGAAPL